MARITSGNAKPVLKPSEPASSSNGAYSAPSPERIGTALSFNPSRNWRIFGAVGTASSFTHLIEETERTMRRINSTGMCTSVDAG